MELLRWSASVAVAAPMLFGCAGLPGPTPTGRPAAAYPEAAAHAAPARRSADVAACGTVRISDGAWICDDGRPFVVLGENRINVYDPAWNWRRLSAPDYVRYMASNGMNTLRVFVVTDVEDEQRGGSNRGVIEPRLGQFDEGVAREFDAIFRAAERNGVYVVLVAFAVGFSPDDDWKSWRDNPYSAERGGPAADRYAFFESPEARARAADRIRFLARRYGASPNLLAIDLLNEPEWDGGIPETAWRPWAQAMARVWREADPGGHPVTVGSVGLHWNVEGDERDWWASAECDVVQWHLYGREVYEVHALAREISRKARETSGYGKPVLLGEFAWGGEAKPAYDHTHVGLWAATFSGAGVLAHSAPPFTIDSDEPMVPERARHFAVLSRFVAPLPAMRPTDASATGDALAWALSGTDTAAVWLMGPEAGYGKPVDGVRVTLTLPGSGSWRVEWWNDVTGRVIERSTLEATDGRVTVVAPRFSRHAAARFTRSTPSRRSS